MTLMKKSDNELTSEPSRILLAPRTNAKKISPSAPMIDSQERLKSKNDRYTPHE